MNKTLLSIIASREDISDYLFHFTTGSNGLGTLNKIIDCNSIIDVKNRGCICLTESPITMLSEMFDIFNKYCNPMYAQYGIAIKKDFLYNIGARPVIYGSAGEINELGESLKWRFEEYIPNVKDFSWLREWRIKEKEIQLDRDNCFIITKTKSELNAILFNDNQFVDLEFYDCVQEGEKILGNVIGTFSRAFRGISFEDLKELDKLSKLELDKLLITQNLDDTESRYLGWVEW